MYIRMSQYCDKVIILRSVSKAIEAFDASGQPINGARKSTTEQIATFSLDEPIRHTDIDEEKALEFESWRDVQLRRIQKAYIENAAAGKLGGLPLLKSKSGMGNELAKVGEFSGIISTMIEVQPGMIKNAINGQRPESNKIAADARSLADETSPETISALLLEISEKIMRRIHLSGHKGTDIYSQAETLDMRAAYTALGCALDKRGIGYKVQGPIAGRNAAEEGLELFNEIKKRITE